MRTFAVILLASTLLAPTAAAQQRCGPVPGTNGGTVQSASLYTLTQRVAAPIAGRVVAQPKAFELNVGLGADPCDLRIGTSVAPGATTPVRDTSLHAIAPNPFNPRATIRFDLATRGPVRIDVYDTAGRHVRTIEDVELAAGSHVRTLDGDGLASGVYRVRLQTTDGDTSRSVVLLK